MDKKDRKLFHNLVLSQGVYYLIIGITLGLFSFFNPSLTSQFVQIDDSGVVAGLLIGVGCSLYKSRSFLEPRNSVYYLGLICAGSILLNQIVHSDDASLLRFADVFVQTVFVVLWSYLLYWRWVMAEFLKLSSKRKKRKHKTSSEWRQNKTS